MIWDFRYDKIPLRIQRNHNGYENAINLIISCRMFNFSGKWAVLEQEVATARQLNLRRNHHWFPQ